MPLYEYQCSKCGRVFEVIQKFSDAPLTTHEDCGVKVDKLLSAPAFHLKGSGWYVTDYAKSGSGGESKSSSKTESKSESSTESKAESKTETKTESSPAASTKSSE